MVSNMKGSGEKLTRHQEKAIAALLEHPTITAAAKASGIAETTLRRWLKLPGFASAYAAARRGIVDGVVDRIHKALVGAFAVVARTLNDPTASHSAKLRASEILFDIGLRERPAGVALPDTGTATGISRAIAAVSQAVSEGRLTPAEAEAIGRLLNAQASALGLADTERRLARLEAALRDSDEGDLPSEDAA